MVLFRLAFLFLLPLAFAAPLWPEEAAVPAPAPGTLAPAVSPEADAASLVGFTLENLVGRFGSPKSVYAVRGSAEWQDDVVFVYDTMDCYIYRDRVWQVGLRTYRKIKIGDGKSAVVLELGEDAMDEGNLIRLSLPGRGWPMELQVNLDAGGLVAAIFISRSDF
ncbi:MAG: hypothetical protein LBG42_09470 [Treponema sp.]|jgi:hypothetical protein|nr:hypothetical protein [Treponema sp.]